MRLIPQNGGIKCVPQNGGAQNLLVEDLNQLGRRNLTREKRDAMIRRLAASGVPKPEIAAAVGLNLRSVQRLAAGERQDVAERPINATTAAQELEAKQDEIEPLRRLAEAVPKSGIAGAVGLSRRRTQEIVQGAETAQAPPFTTPALTVAVHGELNNSTEPALTIPWFLTSFAIQVICMKGPSQPPRRLAAGKRQ